MTPTRLQLEREIVWTAINNGELFIRYSRALSSKMFSDEICRKSIEAMHLLTSSGSQVSWENVTNTVAPGDAFMPDAGTSSSVDLGVAAKRLAEFYVFEHRGALVDSLTTEDNAFAIIDAVNNASNEYASVLADNTRVPKAALATAYLDYCQANSQGGMLRVPTGFPTLNQKCHGGLKLGNMSFLGGGPGSGKTSFMLKIGMNAASRGFETAFIEGEMPVNEIFARLNGQFSNIPVDEIEAGKHLEAAYKFCEHMKFLKYEVQFDFNRNVASLVAGIKAAINEGAKMILVDYLQVFVDKNGRAQDEFAKIKALSEAIRKLTLVNNVHILAASSLNRLEAGAQKLTLNSFYGGSQLGHDCYTAMILTDAEEIGGPATTIREVNCEIVKNRGGYTGSFAIRYNLPTQDMVEESGAGIVGTSHTYERVNDDEPF